MERPTTEKSDFKPDDDGVVLSGQSGTKVAKEGVDLTCKLPFSDFFSSRLVFCKLIIWLSQIFILLPWCKWIKALQGNRSIRNRNKTSEQFPRRSVLFEALFGRQISFGRRTLSRLQYNFLRSSFYFTHSTALKHDTAYPKNWTISGVHFYGWSFHIASPKHSNFRSNIFRGHIEFQKPASTSLSSSLLSKSYITNARTCPGYFLVRIISCWIGVPKFSILPLTPVAGLFVEAENRKIFPKVPKEISSKEISKSALLLLWRGLGARRRGAPRRSCRTPSG